jgi:3-hydroxybutyryl-CoA dehydratase
MNDNKGMKSLRIEDEIHGKNNLVSFEVLKIYGNGLLSAAAGEKVEVGSNIHTDEEFAKTQGLTFAIADGMLSTNYISTLLLENFGEYYLLNGSLFTKFIKPVPVGITLTAKAKITAIQESEKENQLTMDVWTENEEGVKLVVGEAKVTVLR